MSSFTLELVYYLLGVAVVMVCGGLLPLAIPAFKRHLHKALSIGAGVMLGSAFFHMIPDAMEAIGHDLGLAVLSGFLFLYTFEKFITVHVCETVGCEVHTIGLSAFFGLSLHTFVNGVALGSAILSGLGPLVFIAIATHKLPEAFSLSAILLHEHYKRRQIIFMHILFISMIPLGAIAVDAISIATNGYWASFLLAFSAGTFIQIAVSDLLPEVHKAQQGRFLNLFFFFIGIILMALVKD